MTDFTYSKLLASSPDLLVGEFKDCGLEKWQGLADFISTPAVTCSLALRFLLTVREMIGTDQLALSYFERLDLFVAAASCAFGGGGLSNGEATLLSSYVHGVSGRVTVLAIGEPCKINIGHSATGRLAFAPVDRPGVYAIGQGCAVRFCDLVAHAKLATERTAT